MKNDQQEIIVEKYDFQLPKLRNGQTIDANRPNCCIMEWPVVEDSNATRPAGTVDKGHSQGHSHIPCGL